MCYQKNAARINMLVRSSIIEVNGVSLKVAASAGGIVACSGDAVGSLVQRADAMMYKSEEAGRDR